MEGEKDAEGYFAFCPGLQQPIYKTIAYSLSNYFLAKRLICW